VVQHRVEVRIFEGDELESREAARRGALRSVPWLTLAGDARATAL
jgi:hypothetical protein